MYAKLFASIYQGTLRGNTHGLVVFTNMLAHADVAGWVDIHPKAIAEEVGLTLEQVNLAILELESPDPDSRSPEEDGRRIVRLDEHRAWGWRIVNHGKYRAIRNEDDRREQNRLAQQKWRDKHKVSKTADSNESKPTSAEDKQPSAESAHTEAEADTDKKTRAPRFNSVSWLVENGVSNEVMQGWLAVRKNKGLTNTRIAFDEIKLQAIKAGMPLNDVLHICVKESWGGFKAKWLDTLEPEKKKLPGEDV